MKERLCLVNYSFIFFKLQNLIYQILKVLHIQVLIIEEAEDFIATDLRGDRGPIKRKLRITHSHSPDVLGKQVVVRAGDDEVLGAQDVVEDQLHDAGKEDEDDRGEELAEVGANGPRLQR